MIRKHLRAVWGIGWRVGLALFALFQVTFTVAGIRQAVDWPYLDFYTFLRAGMKVRTGQPIYTFDHIIITEQLSNDIVTLQHPLVAVVFTPLSLLPPQIAYHLWLALSVLGWGLAIVLALRAAALPPAGWFVPILLAVSSPGLQWDLVWGQVACLIALGLLLGYLLIRRERWLLAGVVVGILIMGKFLLAPLALPLLLRGRWRALAGLVSGAGLTVVLALPWTGWHAFPAWLVALRDVSWAGSSGNLSVHAYLTRLAGGPLPAWQAATVSLLTVAIGLCILIRPVDGFANTPRFYSGLIAVGILGSPLGWGNYTLFLLPLWALLLTSPIGKARRNIAIAATICLWYSDLGLLPGPWVDLLHTVGLILFVAALSAVPRLQLALHSQRQRGALVTSTQE